MFNGLIEAKNLSEVKVKGKFKVSKILIVSLSFLLIIGATVVILWKMGIFKKMFTPKPGSCLILTESNCKKVKIVEVNGHKMAEANLPQGTILFSPISSSSIGPILVNKRGSTVTDNGARINDNSISYVFLYSDTNKSKVDTDSSIKKGDQIGTINGTKLKNYSDYNLVFYVTQDEQGTGNFILKDDLLLKLFSKNK